MRRVIYILLSLIPILSSCDKIGKDGIDDRSHIYLSASVEDVDKTKAPYLEPSGHPTRTSPLDVAVWASTTSGVYKNEGKTGIKKGQSGTSEVAIHTTAHFESGQAQLLSAAIYPPPDDTEQNPMPVYFVSLYPKEGWSLVDETQANCAQYTFNGSQDLMFAGPVSGTYRMVKEDRNYPTLTYNHLLTLFNIKIGMDPQEIADGITKENISEAWGKVTDIYIMRVDQSTENFYPEGVDRVEVSLSEPVSATFAANSNEGTKFYNINTDEVFPGAEGYTVTETLTHLAYTMYAPTTATAKFGDTSTLTPEYELTVVTQKRGEVVVKLDLMHKDNGQDAYYTGSTAGKQFDVSLYVKKGKIIRHKVEVTSWDTGGYGPGNLFD